LSSVFAAVFDDMGGTATGARGLSGQGFRIPDYLRPAGIFAIPLRVMPLLGLSDGVRTDNSVRLDSDSAADWLAEPVAVYSVARA
jgi:hypothetical protein